MANITTFVVTIATNVIVDTPKYYNKFGQIQKLLVQMTIPYIFIVAFVGFITNSATIILLSKNWDSKNTKQKWTLIALALSDLVYNTALFIRVIQDITHHKIQNLCIIISFLSQLAEILSAAFTVLFTLQRYTAVRYPLETATHNRSSPIVFIFFIFLLSLIFCLALLYDNTHIDCYPELKLRWFIADALVSFICPFTLILLFNIRIITLIRRHARSSISKQSIVLKAHKHKKQHSKGKTFEIQSIIYSTEKGETINMNLSETEVDDSVYSNSSPLGKFGRSKISKSSSEPSVSFAPNEGLSFNSVHDNKQKFHLTRSSDHSNDIDLHKNRTCQTRQSIRVTRMLVLVSTCFLILNAPAHISVIIATIHSKIESPVFNHHSELEHFQQTRNLTDHQLKNFVFIQEEINSTKHSDIHSFHDRISDDDQILIHLLYLIVVITQLISYASYSINFFLYSYSGMMFRSNLNQFFEKLRKCEH